MNVTKQELNKYLKQIKKLLVCNGSRRKEFMDSFDDNLEEYLTVNPDADMRKIQTEMGTPQEIANAFLENESAASIKKRMSVVRCIKIGVIIALFLLAITLVFELVDAYRADRGYTEETITEEYISEDNIEEAIIEE